nr:hypothetical protein CFP56_44047 [Quercus suber]
MTPDKTSWNRQLIDSIFLPHEAQKIKALSLCVVPQIDYFYWNLEKSGIYSVKSGYKLLCEEERKEEALGSSRQGMSVLCSRIWRLKWQHMDLVDLCVTKPGMGELFRTTAWFIWIHRNKVRLNDRTSPLSRVGEAAKNLVQHVQSVREGDVAEA